MKTFNRHIVISTLTVCLSCLTHAARADDSDIFTTGQFNSSQRPQVMIILDTSDSMSAKATGVIRQPYEPDFFYTGWHRNKDHDWIFRNYYEENEWYSYPPVLGDREPSIPDISSSNDTHGECQTIDDEWKCTGNFINWQYASRLDTAKKTIRKVIRDNPSIDFGLAEFTTSSKVIHKHLKTTDDAYRQEITSTLLGARNSANTPMCNTYYEVYRYFSGDSPRFSADPNSIENISGTGNTYKTPVTTCQNLYIIYMSDGAASPHWNDDSTTKIKQLTSVTNCKVYGSEQHCLPELAAYMANPPSGGLDRDTTTGTQKAYTYTIGFDTDQTLLFDTANAGKGQCYTTVGNNMDPAAGCIAVDSITDAFEGALQEILKGSSNFVSPAVAVNSFNRTETLDHAYFAMFEPDSSPNWKGNLKKLKIYTGNETSGTCVDKTNLTIGKVVDRSCNPAIAAGTLQLDEGISTFWGTTSDGKQVDEGGYGEVLKNTNTSRSFYTNKSIGNAPEALVRLNQLDENDLHVPSGNTDLLAHYRKWIRGRDTNGVTRDWVLGDIQHSKPLTLNYGARTSSFSKTNPDIRLAFGTNHGILHFLQDSGSTVAENWSFFAKETAKNIPLLFNNQPNTSHPYGLDGEISMIRLDVNGDGNIIGTDGDRMTLFFGMRRGGDSYYAIDVTNPDDPPKLLWRINSDTPGFSELGQSWAKAVPLLIPGHRQTITDDNNAVSYKYKFALAISAGYDGQDDATSTQGKDDYKTGNTSNPIDTSNNEIRPYSTRGRGLFFVDAGTGTLIKSFVAPDTIDNDAPNRVEDSRFKWSIAAPPAVIDSNGNGFHDRIYAADTGGNIFRFDIGLGTDSNDNEIAVWSVITLAKLGIDENGSRSAPDSSSDRRFFYQPEVAKTQYAGSDFDGVMLGSGNRANPTATSATDRYFMIRDSATSYRRYGSCGNDCATPPAAITSSNLYDTTENLIQQGDAAEQVTASNDLSSAKGWYMNLGLASSSVNTYEQVMTKARLLSGVLSFTTFSPSAIINSESCAPGRGSSRVYSIDMHTSRARNDFNSDNTTNKNDRVLGVYSGVSGGGTTAAIGNKYIDILTGDEVNSKLGMNAYGWFQER